MKLIVAVSKSWGIGKDNRLLFSIPADMKFFRDTTKGHTVVMGRKTLESLPGGKPLKNRRNIVLSTSIDSGNGIEAVRNVNELLKLVGKDTENVFIIGGESVYRELLPFADTAFVTKVDAENEADCFMPDLDSDKNWVLSEKSNDYFENGLTFRFCTYVRKGRDGVLE